MVPYLPLAQERAGTARPVTSSMRKAALTPGVIFFWTYRQTWEAGSPDFRAKPRIPSPVFEMYLPRRSAPCCTVAT